ncbi:MAG TPA: ABC transporter permease subunit [Gaiellaceae bacterium]|nr:ABC transporter permease subunit [Gaiellaceae bacterium]
MSSTGIRAEFPREGGTPPAPKTSRWHGLAIPFAFLAPALLFLSVWVIYPMLATMWRSLFSDRGDRFVGLDNYERLFTDDRLLTALKNNALWVLIIPAAVTAVGLVFAVLVERVRWSVAFKIAVFMPLAVSLFAVGVIWRIMYQQDPERGVINAGIAAVKGKFTDEGVLSSAAPSTDDLEGTPKSGFVLKQTVGPGDTALLGLTAVRVPEIPEAAEDAAQPEAVSDGIAGVVWRDFSPGGDSRPGRVDTGEVGLPGVKIELRDADGKRIDSTTAANDGTFAFEGVEAGDYRLAIANTTFVRPFGGVNWLGSSLITPSIMFSYIWVTAGFAMVIIGAGLASIPRDTLEAARTDGATEWQVFRRITVPLLAPVLTVVFVTQIIGVLKIFDLVLAVAPGSSQDDAATLAFVMWQRSFSGQNLFGLGSAISTFLLLLFIPFLIINIRRFRREAS